MSASLTMPREASATLEWPAARLAEVEEALSHYPNKRSAALPVLWIAQREWGGWLPDEAIQAVAAELDLPEARVYGGETVETADDAIRVVEQLLRPGDCVLVKGARALGLERVADAELAARGIERSRAAGVIRPEIRKQRPLAVALGAGFRHDPHVHLGPARGKLDTERSSGGSRDRGTEQRPTDARERIDRTQHAPLTSFDPSAINPGGEQKIILYCAGGRRSLEAAAKLAPVCNAEVYSMAGGMSAWKQAGLPIAVNRKAPLPIMR